MEHAAGAGAARGGGCAGGLRGWFRGVRLGRRLVPERPTRGGGPALRPGWPLWYVTVYLVCSKATN